jgi:hypothetical protein
MKYKRHTLWFLAILLTLVLLIFTIPIIRNFLLPVVPIIVVWFVLLKKDNKNTR